MMIEVMCCPINYLHEAVVSLTKPLEWSKTKAAVSLSSNCTAASENSRREHAAVNQPEMNPGRKRGSREDGWHHSRNGGGGIPSTRGRWRARRVSAQNMSAEEVSRRNVQVISYELLVGG